jgi:hypothetical protein
MNIKSPIALCLLGASIALILIGGIDIGVQLGNQTTKTIVRPVPVNIEYRRSKLGNGYVFRFADIGTSELFCTVTVRNSSVWKQYRLDLRPKDSREIGVLQGWEAFPGDSCTVEAEGYAQIKAQIPASPNL